MALPFANTTGQDYKFTLSFENMATPGYLTEKLFNAYLAWVVPVYWGDPDVDELVNTDAFVWCRKNLTTEGRATGPWDECLKRIMALDQDDVLYRNMLSQPLLKWNKLPDWMSTDVLAKRLLHAWDMIDAQGCYRRPLEAQRSGLQ